MTRIAMVLATLLASAGTAQTADPASTAGDSNQWSTKTAAAYLDQRAEWWSTWSSAARDHGTFCVSCHTALPYALGRPALRAALGEQTPSSAERTLLENVRKRVRLWNEVDPFYTDAKNGAPKSAESRGTESVLNALILSSYDAPGGKLSEDTRNALDHMWSQQLKSGDAKGAFTWLNFHNEPWEADDSQFWGSTLAALAVGFSSQEYRSIPDVQTNLALLSEYLRRTAPGQSSVNRAFLLWASTKIPGLLDKASQSAIVKELLSKQREDGGWSASSLVVANWKRRDSTPLDTVSDGYGTGLVSFVLEQAGLSSTESHVKSARAWLCKNQDASVGLWPATSLNKKRDPATDAARFMSDAGTAYSVLALVGDR